MAIILKSINKKNILDCESEEEIRLHNQEVQNILDELYEMDSVCQLTIKRIDLPEIYKEEKIMRCKSQDIEEILLSCDFKNGVNVYVNDERSEFIFVIIGQGYTYKGIYGLVQKEVKVKL